MKPHPCISSSLLCSSFKIPTLNPLSFVAVEIDMLGLPQLLQFVQRTERHSMRASLTEQRMFLSAAAACSVLSR